ncbi:MAG: ABC-F family ATP-binding cassette domain-containing protein [Paludibacteraceae bacterium]|nr:ABC-F family ATP-binding cassette domain-containing protein [Paludibacteraceae bacterium]
MALNYLQVENLAKSFGDNFLFKNISFGLFEGQRVALIAKNGAGKSTLLNIIAGNESYDAGKVTFRSDLNVGFLPQDPRLDGFKTVEDVCIGTGDSIRMKQMLGKLKIVDMEQELAVMSGGQVKRVALAKVLVSNPELLILDEPTNHLDLEMVEWLEDYLRRSRMALLMVTHDRYFLDRVCSDIMELDQEQLFTYKGNYSYYLEKRQERIDVQNAELQKANNLFRKELDWMRRQPQARGSKAQYRIDAFHDLEKKVNAPRATGTVKLDVKASYIGSKIFEAKHVNKAFGDLKILDDFNYTFNRYEKLGIVGNNGTGKSTFVKMLVGEEMPDSGVFDIGETVRFGYYSQQGMTFNPQMKVIDAVRDIAEVVQLGDGKKLTVGQFLNLFLFTPETQQKFIAKLSGGERRRLYLCTVLMRNPNFLVLDEPTNDLDIMTLQVLEEYLQSFKGCVIVISHDRYFMDKVVDHLFVFHGNANVQDFPGNYTDYREYREMKLYFERQEKENAAKPKVEAQAPQREKKERARKMSFQEQREFEQLEKDLAQLETEKSELETALSSGTLNGDELVAKSNRVAEIIDLLDEKEMRWLELSEIGK